MTEYINLADLFAHTNMDCPNLNFRKFSFEFLISVFLGYVLGDIFWWPSFEWLERTFKSWLANSCCNSRTWGRCFSFYWRYIFTHTRHCCMKFKHHCFSIFIFHLLTRISQSKVTLILLECWYQRSFELRIDQNKEKCIEMFKIVVSYVMLILNMLDMLLENMNTPVFVFLRP